MRLETMLDRRPAAVFGDSERLQQVLWNLLSNAVKFTDRGGCVRVRLTRLASELELSVTDTGAGIDPQFLPHVFERFRQADAGITRTHGGLGLGLAITRHLVELQGGRVAVESEGLGRGSTFRIHLPLLLKHRTADFEEAESAVERSSALTVPRLTGVRVLAVDDDQDALALVREILETTGATVVTADSGEQALETMQRADADVLLADLAMPQMSGFELIDRVRRSDHAATRSIPAAAITAFARDEDRAKALRSGFQLHLAKPVDPAELMAAVVELSQRGRQA